ncbi:MAG: T9SS type A sorting domain-containing protein, partial [Bacteroidia bacterium]
MRIFIHSIVIFLFSLLLLEGQGQIVYSGFVKDVVSGEYLPDARISILNQNTETNSDFFGNFVLTQGDFTYDSPSRPYSFFQNVIIWAENYTFSLELFSLDGQKVLNRNLGGSQGSFVLPGLPYGIYILRISSRNETLSFKAYSDGQKTFPVDRDISWHPRNGEQGYDTLLIQKEGYFDRQLIVPRRDTLLEIALLKGNYEDLDYFNELIDPIAFDLISSLPSRSHQGGVRSVKVIYNEKDGLMYYQNTNKYIYHFFFAWKVLGFNQGNNIFNLTQYRENPDRYLYPGNINYYKNLDKYVLHLVAA